MSDCLFIDIDGDTVGELHYDAESDLFDFHYDAC